MHNENLRNRVRRSSRVPVTIPILVTSLEPGTHFSEVCETLVVSAHGCAMRSRVKLNAGVPLHLHSRDGRETTGQVVFCQAIGSNTHTWKLGARLDQPENFWGLRECPADWAALLAAPTRAMLTEPHPARTTVASSRQRNDSSDLVLEATAGLTSEDEVKNLIRDAVRPLQAEIAALKEKLARTDANRSRFEVSLSSIPPELEQQLETRLQKDLGPKVLNEARHQSAELLRAAETTIEQRTAQAYEAFVQRAGNELQVIEQRARDVAGQISESVRQQISAGVRELQKKVIEADEHLKTLTGQLFEFVQQKLQEEHSNRCAELDQVRSAVGNESARLNENIAYLDSRVRKLDECARSLESSLDERLQQMAEQMVSRMRTEVENVAESILKEFTSRGVEALGNQLDEACGNLKIVQKGIVTSASDSMKIELRDAVAAFERSMDEQAERALERWRQILAGGLNGLVKSLGDQFRVEARPGIEQSSR
ncbi:MAG: hypothetical protein JO356_18500 [Acidobacteria bacterium]|nr:hypothetical protein [Acidobacteriota bacterium]